MKKSGGFTLIELSIVVVVIGLLIGGVIAGQQMIRNTRVNSVATDFKKIESAVVLFRDRFKALPGDMPNAQAMWGANACTGAAFTDNTTCNGCGDGKIEDATCPNEGYYLWHHLRISEVLTDLNMTRYGYIPGAAPFKIPGNNIPVSRIDGAGYAVRYNNDAIGLTWATSPYPPNLFNKHMIQFGGNDLTTPVITPQEAASIDGKMDDGLPGAGRVVGAAAATQCATNTAAQVYGSTTATYNTTDSTLRCYLAYLILEEKN